jgi:ribosomal protein S18 acetylase RimI-like enzyme
MTDATLVHTDAYLKSNAPAYKIRTFHFHNDYAATIYLWQNAGPGISIRKSDQRNEIKKKLQRDPDLFLVAELDGKIIGSVLAGFDGRRGMMYHLAIDRQYRKQGIGSSLVAELEKRLRKKGCLRWYLLVYPDNLEAIDFYEKRGWKRMPLFAYGKNLD